MQISGIQLLNEASFEDTGSIEFGPGLNFIVGQNNTGKSAFLKALAGGWTPNPHRNDKVFKREQLATPQQRVQAKFRGPELLGAWQRWGNGFDWSGARGTEVDVKRTVSEFFAAPEWSCELTRAGGPQVLIKSSPHNSNTEQGYSFRPGPDGPVFGGYGHYGDNFQTIIQLSWVETVFLFNAQRYNVGRCNISMSERLQPDAANLPAVLMRLQGNQGDVFRTLVQHMRDVFPSVKNLSVTSPDGSQELEILIWPVVEQLHREISTSLNESGTGLSQVLAILTVAMTMTESVILIDEIGSFLHPSAAKNLVRILETHYPQHQYIITTHSTEVLASCSPSTVHLVRKTDFTSSIVPINLKQISDLRGVASELGMSMADVFASQHVVWVEGPTEEVCFPFIFEETRVDTAEERRAISPQFVAVVATGDFTAKRNRHELVFDIYNRLSTASAALTGAATFAFDREELSEGQIAELQRRASDRLCILPRRHFECYLLSPEAIASVMNAALEGSPVTAEMVRNFLRENGGDTKFKAEKEWTGALDDEAWLAKVDAARLLEVTFSQLSEARVSFSKRQHSFQLTKAIMESDRMLVRELITFVNELVGLARAG